MKKLKGALIGCGFFAENHILAWKELRNIEIICVCDLDIKKAIGTSLVIIAFKSIVGFFLGDALIMSRDF